MDLSPTQKIFLLFLSFILNFVSKKKIDNRGIRTHEPEGLAP